MVLARLRRRNREDSGFALLTVIMSMFVLTMIVSAAMTYAVQTQVGSRRDQDSNGALTAARAGIDDMISRLNTNDNYWQQYPGYSASSADFDCTNTAWKRPGIAGSPCTAAWGATPSVGWTAVPGAPGALYHYDLDLTNAFVDGKVIVTSTGSARGVTRTVQASLLRDGFGEYLYLTDYDVVDPADEATYGVNNQAAQTKCHLHYWEGRDTSGFCRELSFGLNELFTGPVHSNDRLIMDSNPHFTDTVTTSWSNCPAHPTVPQYSQCWGLIDASASATPVFDKGIAFHSVINFPTSIGSMRKYVDPAQSTTPGCLYSGPTRIKFNSNGTMQVWSKWSKAPMNPGCGTADATHLWSAGGETVNVPDKNVVYVQDVPAGQVSPAANNGTCPPGGIGDGFPVAFDYNNGLQDYLCNKGTAYIGGVLKGRLTVATDDNIVVTDNLTYAGATTGTDVMGLIANNAIRVYHPVFCYAGDFVSHVCTAAVNLPRPDGTTWTNATVYASMLALAHSYGVQSPTVGAFLGYVIIFGAVAQRFRGQVGTGAGTSGYIKAYVYDTRLKTAPPPFFLNPISAQWGAKTYGEIKRAY